jgi:catechol 2,3-dioxygenase-like lactoylglutathione lyase family enzyme
MFFGVSHVDIPVSDLVRARGLYEGILGFTAVKQGEGWVDLSANTTLLRLVQTRRPEHRASIRVQVSDVDAAHKALLGAGARCLYEPMRTPDLELLASASDLDGHTISVWRALSEDEYGFVPELPKVMTWKPEAEELLKSLLLSVPSLFRALARYKVSRLAEELAGATKLVSTDCVVRAFILSNAKITRYRVREPLIRHGYSPDDYKDEFDA